MSTSNETMKTNYNYHDTVKPEARDPRPMPPSPPTARRSTADGLHRPGTFHTVARKNPQPVTGSRPLSSLGLGKSSSKKRRQGLSEDRISPTKRVGMSLSREVWLGKLRGGTSLSNHWHRHARRPQIHHHHPSPILHLNQALTFFLASIPTSSPDEILTHLERFYEELRSLIQRQRKIVAGSVDKAVQTKPPGPPTALNQICVRFNRSGGCKGCHRHHICSTCFLKGRNHSASDHHGR